MGGGESGEKMERVGVLEEVVMEGVGSATAVEMAHTNLYPLQFLFFFFYIIFLYFQGFPCRAPTWVSLTFG